MKIRLLLIMLIISCATILVAQVPLFKQLQEQDGLLSNKIYDLRLHDGDLWIASDKGLSKYDGKRFSHYYTHQGLTENEIIKLQIDAQNRLWAVGSSSRLSFFSKEKFIALSSNDIFIRNLNNRIINTINSENNGDIYVTTVLGGGTIRIRNLSNVEPVKQDWVNGASFFIKQLSANHFIWGSTNSQSVNKKLKIKLLKNSQEINLTASQGFSKACFIKIMSGEYLYAKDQELIHFNDSIIIGRSFLEKNIECIYEDREGKIWVGLNAGGAVCFPMGTISAGGYFSYFGNKTISAVCEDSKGNLWLASLESGLFFLPPNPYSNYTPPKVFSSAEQKNNNTIAKTSHTNDTLLINSLLTDRYAAIFLNDTITNKNHYDTLPPLIYISGIKIN